MVTSQRIRSPDNSINLAKDILQHGREQRILLRMLEDDDGIVALDVRDGVLQRLAPTVPSDHVLFTATLPLAQ